MRAVINEAERFDLRTILAGEAPEEHALNMILCEKWYNNSVRFNPL